MANLQNNFRYERKYKLDISDYAILVHNILSDGMKVHHPARYINNVYFDSLDMESYFENVEGESKRSKYRLRWYGERFNLIDPIFEVKMKQDQVNKKETLKISEIEFRNLDDVEKVSEHLLSFMQENETKLFFDMFNKTPSLLNGYERDYFLSEDGKTRLTIDRNLFFYNCRNNQQYTQDNMMVVEVKYASHVIPKINFDKFELILGKSSKYVSGIDYTKIK